MKPIREVYPDGRYGFYDYEPLLDSFEYELLLKIDENDYQGDSWVLYRDGDKYGYLEFGWGSCSGCDALQACDSYEEVEKLQKELHESIKWFENREKALQWFTEHDWAGDWSWCGGDGELASFVKQATILLGEVTP